MKIMIFGAGNGGKRLLDEIRRIDVPYELVAFIDNRLKGTYVCNTPVISPEQIANYEYDLILIATIDGTVKQLLVDKYGIPESRINVSWYHNSYEIGVRVQCLKNIASMIKDLNITGSVAELGVYQGDFAKIINELFPDRKLYLYDTFEGFAEPDIKEESAPDVVSKYTHYALTSEAMVLSRMPHKDMVVIRKGRFPETAIDINETFAFVSLDADLYEPTLAGLRFFYPRMEKGGIILIHDFIDMDFDGVKKAVYEFIHEHELSITPIGDYRTLALVKPLKI